MDDPDAYDQFVGRQCQEWVGSARYCLELGDELGDGFCQEKDGLQGEGMAEGAWTEWDEEIFSTDDAVKTAHIGYRIRCGNEGATCTKR